MSFCAECGNRAEFQCRCGTLCCNQHARYGWSYSTPTARRFPELGELWKQQPQRACGECDDQAAETVAGQIGAVFRDDPDGLARRLFDCEAWQLPYAADRERAFGPMAMRAAGVDASWVVADPGVAQRGLDAAQRQRNPNPLPLGDERLMMLGRELAKALSDAGVSRRHPARNDPRVPNAARTARAMFPRPWWRLGGVLIRPNGTIGYVGRTGKFEPAKWAAAYFEREGQIWRTMGDSSSESPNATRDHPFEATLRAEVATAIREAKRGE